MISSRVFSSRMASSCRVSETQSDFQNIPEIHVSFLCESITVSRSLFLSQGRTTLPQPQLPGRPEAIFGTILKPSNERDSPKSTSAVGISSNLWCLQFGYHGPSPLCQLWPIWTPCLYRYRTISGIRVLSWLFPTSGRPICYNS